MSNKREPDIIIPVNIDANWLSRDEIIRDIRKQHDEYGFRRFGLCLPAGGWRSVGYPPKEYFLQKANEFRELKEALSPFGIELGWCHCLTVKSGRSVGFSPIIRSDGSTHSFANCPLDEAFRKRFSEDAADFSEIAKPSFIFLEDDFSLAAADGCYCEKHISEFNRRYSLNVTRKELKDACCGDSPEKAALAERWHAFSGDTLAEFAAAMRKELDRKSPEIPIGLWQNSGDFIDGFCTERVCRALAGKNHIPFARLAGADYSGMKSKEIPLTLYKAQYCKETIPNFRAYLEADTYPHTRFFTAACQIISLIALGLSFGFEGVIFHTMQQFDNPNEETAYGKAYKREKKRLDEVFRMVRNGALHGAGIPYDPSQYAKQGALDRPFWLESVARFGIPYTTKESSVVFWDETLAKSSSDEEIRKVLSKTLFLDGNAARVLYHRGFGDYLGVEVGEDVTKDNNLLYDLGAREVITPSFRENLEGGNMFAPWMYSPGGNGISFRLTPLRDNLQVVSEIYDFRHQFVTNGMTLFENDLGGNVIVMGMTMNHNHSQSLLNYRRRSVIQSLIRRCCDEYYTVLNAPDVILAENAFRDKEPFSEMLTLVGLGEDKTEEITLHIPKTRKEISEIRCLDYDGVWQKTDFTRKGDTVMLPFRLTCCEPMFILIQ